MLPVMSLTVMARAFSPRTNLASTMPRTSWHVRALPESTDRTDDVGRSEANVYGSCQLVGLRHVFLISHSIGFDGTSGVTVVRVRFGIGPDAVAWKAD